MADLIVPTSRTVRDLLVDYFSEWHLTQGSFAQAIGFSQKHVSQIMLDKTFANPSVALGFEAGTGVPVGVWVALSAETQARRMRVAQQRWIEQVGARMDVLRRTRDERTPTGRRKGEPE